MSETAKTTGDEESNEKNKEQVQEEETKSPRERCWIIVFRIVSIVLVIAGVIFCSVFLYRKSVFLPMFEWVQDHKAGGAVLSILGYIIWIVCAQTHSVLDLIMGVIFGIGIGLVIGMIGTFLGSMTAFLIGRFALQKWIRKLLQRNRKMAILAQALKKGRNGFQVNSTKILNQQMTVICRLSLPSQLVNYGICATEGVIILIVM